MARSLEHDPTLEPRATSDGLSSRITILAITQVALIVLLLVFDLIVWDPAQLPLTLALIVPLLIATGVLYLLRSTRYAELAVYIDLTLGVLLLAIADPISQILVGDTWALFQLVPPIAILILRKPRTAIIMVVITAVLLLASALVLMTGLMPAVIILPQAALIRGLAYQVLVLIMLAFVVNRISAGEQRALAQSARARRLLHEELAATRLLAEEKELLNARLVQQLAELSERDQQISRQQDKEARLQQTIQTLSNPVIPIFEGIILMPLVGVIQAERAEQLQRGLLQGIEHHQARIAILDVTGVAIIDREAALAILQAATAARLIGAQPMLVGIRPEVAQTLVGLGIDLQQLTTQANLQAGVTNAIKLLS